MLLLLLLLPLGLGSWAKARIHPADVKETTARVTVNGWRMGSSNDQGRNAGSIQGMGTQGVPVDVRRVEQVIEQRIGHEAR